MTLFQVMLWKRVAEEFFLKNFNDLPIVLENVSFKRATVISQDDETEIFVNISAKSGNFEIFESGEIIVSGKIRGFEKLPYEIEIPNFDSSNLVLKRSDIYKEFSFRKQQFSESYQGILECDISGENARIEWKEDMNLFLESLTQLIVCQSPNLRGVFLQTYFQRLSIDPIKFLKCVSNNSGMISIIIRSYSFNNIIIRLI